MHATPKFGIVDDFFKVLKKITFYDTISMKIAKKLPVYGIEV